MPIVLLRVDERLIHGQVVVGWGERLHPDRIIVVDDELAESAWEQELYCLGLPPETEARFVSVADARGLLSGWRSDAHRCIVLLRDVATLARLAADGALRGEAVNLGGIHHAPNRTGILPYLFLSDDEGAALRRVAGEGAEISARDVPGSRRVPLDELLQNLQ